MSEPTAPSGEAEAGKSRKLLPILLAAGGLLVGMAGGAFVAVPLFASKLPSSASAPKSSKADHEEEEEKHEKDEKGDGAANEPNAAAMYTVDNLVMNPAGTGGTRFIMLTVAIQLSNAAQVEALKQRDAELRDLIVSLFSRKTVDELADASLRDSLRVEVTSVVSPLVPKKAMRRVFFPQFVIQ